MTPVTTNNRLIQNHISIDNINKGTIEMLDYKVTGIDSINIQTLRMIYAQYKLNRAVIDMRLDVQHTLIQISSNREKREYRRWLKHRGSRI